jgi:hypothetical protein
MIVITLQLLSCTFLLTTVTLMIRVIQHKNLSTVTVSPAFYSMTFGTLFVIGLNILFGNLVLMLSGITSIAIHSLINKKQISDLANLF